MSNKHYVTITHYKEREFFFLNHAIQTNDGFITKGIEQFHESEQEKLIDNIRALQTKYPTHQIISLSLNANQIVKDKEDPSQASAKISENNYVIQEKIDISNIPVTLYFSPFAVLYEEYKHKLDEKLTLIIGLFDRKLYIMFVTKDKIHQSWTLGTRGLSEKQIADRVYKSMKAYYKISFKFADHIEMLVSDDSPKLLKVLRDELSMNIILTQKTIHHLLHYMGAEQRRYSSSYIKSFLSANKETTSIQPNNSQTNKHSLTGGEAVINNLEDLKLNDGASNANLGNDGPNSFLNKLKSLFSSNSSDKKSVNLFSFLPLGLTLLAGGYFSIQTESIQNKSSLLQSQSYAQTSNSLLAINTKDIFNAMGKSAELKSAIISNENIHLTGVVWGIEPLRNALTDLYSDGNFVIKPLENFMTEFSFKSKV